MATYVPPKINTAFIMYVGLPSATNSSIFQSNPTLASGDAKVSIDGGALANLGTLPAVTPASSKMVKITMASGEMNGDNITIVLSDQTSPPEWADVIINIQTSAQQVDDLATQTSVNTIDDFLDTEVAAIKAKTDQLTFTTSNRVDSQVFGMQADTVTASAIAADAIGSSELAATAASEIATAVRTELATELGRVDVAVSTRASQASVDTIDGIVDAILVDTGTDIPATLTTINGKIDTVDTNVDAILVDTGTDIPASIANLDADVANVDSDLAALVADIGANGSGLTAVPWNSSWDAEVESEVQDALVAYDVATGTDVSGVTPPTADAIADEIETRTLDANIVQVNSIPVDGTGTDNDPWGPV